MEKGFFVLPVSKIKDGEGFFVLRSRKIEEPPSSKIPPIFEEVALRLPSDLRTDLWNRRSKMRRVLRSSGPKIED